MIRWTWGLPQEVFSLYSAIGHKRTKVKKNKPRRKYDKDDEITIFEDVDDSSKSKKKKTDVIVASVMGLALIGLSVCVTQIAEWRKENDTTHEIVETLREETIIEDEIVIEDVDGLLRIDIPSYTVGDMSHLLSRNIYFDVDWSNLRERNSDTVLWLRFEGAGIDMPVVQGANNHFYLYRDFYKRDTRAGWVFLDSDCILSPHTRNMIIYGHNREDGSAFGSLRNLIRPSIHERPENRRLIINTPDHFYVYQLFSLRHVSAFDSVYTMYFESDIEFGEYLDISIERSLIDFETEVTPQDRILTLSTCRGTGNERLVVQFRLIDLYFKEG
jgi:SrtB family sortase